MSDATVEIPKVGRVKKTYVYVGAAVVAGVVGYAYWRNGQTQAPADIPAYTDADITTDGVTDTAGGAAGGSANSGGLNVNTSTTPGTDSAWVQQANELLSGQFESGALSVALGRYITHEGLTAAQQDMVRAAIGLLGYPPGGAYALVSDAAGSPSTFNEPTGLKATAVGSTSVTVTWNKVTGASGYRTFRGDTGNEPVGDSGDTTAIFRGLEPNHSYTLYVAARTATGATGPRSQPLTVKTQAVKLGTPSAPSVSGITRTSAAVKTGKVSGATGYNWYVNGVAHGHSDTPAYTLAGLHPNTTYQVSVAADTSNQPPGKQSGRKSFKTKK